MPFISIQRTSSLPSAVRTFTFAISLAFFLVLSTGGAGGQTVEDDHGNSFDTATLVSLGSSVDGRIDPGDDRDVFKIDLTDTSESTDLWVYTLGEFDTYGGLYDSAGTPIAFNDDGFFSEGTRNFSIRNVVPPGVYYVITVSFLGEPGDYTLHAQAVSDPGNTTDTAAPLNLGSPTGGTIDTPDDADYFKLDFTESQHVIIDAVSADIFPIDGALLDADGNEISANIYPLSSALGFESLSRVGFTISEDFEPGTYYIRVTTPFEPVPDDPESEDAPPPFRPIPYAVFFSEDTEYTELLDDCEAETRTLNDPQISDPLYACQWHLSSPEWQDINVEPAWADGVMGEGINVAVIDDGMYHAHEDLRDNVNTELNHDYSGNEDIYGRIDHHGTYVAGVIAARDNDIGVRGVAPRATLYGYNLLSGFNMTDGNILDAMSRNGAVTAVSNNSWGWPDGPGLSPASSFWRQAIKYGITAGYNGKGIFYVFGAGNGHLLGDDSNLGELSNDYGVTAVCSVHSGDSRAVYSEMGANLWVCAPSNDGPSSLGGTRGILTTENSDRYYQDFGGTSAATPIVSGVAALTRDANPDLTWRDIKLILAASAQKNDPASLGWEDGASKQPISSTERYHFNHEYGFGVVNAEGAVDLAKRWTNLPATQETTVFSDVLNVEIPDAPATGEPSTFTHALTLDTDIEFTEFVEVTVAFEHGSFRDLEIELESPSGAVSRLAVPFDTYDGLSFFFDGGFVPLYGSFQFGSAKHLGEDPNGEWKLHVTDHISVVEGIFNEFAITVYGHERAPGVATLDSVAVNPGGEALDVAWSAPDEAGDLDITAYDARYIPTSADETDPSNRIVLESVWTADAGGALEYKVTELTDGTQYDVQVRAVNSAGGGLWSETGTGTPMSSPCVTGGAVADRTNSGLINDCEALLEARDVLAGSVTLNWAEDAPIWMWNGVSRDGGPLRVTRLDLRDENLSGTIPAALSRLSSLQRLLLNRNELTGSIPAELGDLDSLVVLNLHSNMLSGAIPNLSGMTSLEDLYLSSNGLSGGIPESLGAMTSVKELWLWGNDLSGSIPDLSGMTSLKMLKLQSNGLSGGVPMWLGSMASLRHLYIHDNPLGGEIPEQLGQNTTLRYLWLHSSQLIGEIPEELAGMTGLVDLNLRNNELTGEVPEQLGSMSNLEWLRLHDNRLTGAIPMQLGGLNSLTHLWLSENLITGQIPSELGNLTSLKSLNLRDNRLSGPIPSELGELGDILTHWRLSMNRLTGCVPAELVAVTDNDMAALGLRACP